MWFALFIWKNEEREQPNLSVAMQRGSRQMRFLSYIYIHSWVTILCLEYYAETVFTVRIIYFYRESGLKYCTMGEFHEQKIIIKCKRVLNNLWVGSGTKTNIPPFQLANFTHSQQARREILVWNRRKSEKFWGFLHSLIELQITVLWSPGLLHIGFGFLLLYNR